MTHVFSLLCVFAVFHTVRYSNRRNRGSSQRVQRLGADDYVLRAYFTAERPVWDQGGQDVMQHLMD